MADLPTVKPGDLPGPQIKPASSGAGTEALGEAVSGLAQTGLNIGNRIHQEQAAAAATKAEADAQEQATAVMADALNAKGENAYGANVQARASIEKIHQQIGSTLSDPLAKSLFEKRFLTLQTNYHDSLTMHVAQQGEQVKQDSLTAKAVADQNAAVLPGVDQKQIDLLAASFEGPAKALFGATAGALRAQEHRADLLHDAITANLQRQDQDPGALDRAKALFYANREALGPRGIQLEEAINHAGLARQGLAIGDQIASGAVKDGQVDYDHIGSELMKITDPKLREIARQTATEDAKFKAEGFNQSVDGLYAGLMKTWDQTHRSNALDPTAIAKLQSMGKPGVDAWQRIQANMHADIDRWKDQPLTDSERQAVTAFEVDVVDHPEKYATLTPEAIDRRVLASLPRKYQDRGRAMLLGLREQAGKPVPLPPADEHMLLSLGRDAGVFGDGPVANWDPAQATAYAVANDAVAARGADYRRNNGKPPPDDLKRQWITEELLKGHVAGSGVLGFFQTKTTPLQLQLSGQGLGQFEPDWSDEQKTQAANALQGAGVQPSQQAVERYLRLKYGVPAQPLTAEPPPAAPEEPTAGIMRGSL